MSLHKSLRGKNSMARTRNVLTRWERLQKLRKDERWREGDSPFGLPKTRTLAVKVGGKKKKAPPKAEAADKKKK